jgi:cobalt-zinc-cadmium efflux system protein
MTGMPHEHQHSHSLGGRLLIGVALNVGMLALQIGGGIAANSLGLLSDAAHNGSDVAALGMAYAADRVGRRSGTARLTYAYGRWEVLVALINAVALVAVSALIVYEAVLRLLHPSPVHGLLVMIVASAGVVGNALAAWLLEGEQSVNARSAFLHLAGDAAASGAVLAGGLVVWLAHLNAVDAALSIAIALWITRGAIKVVLDAGRILLEGVPVGLDLAGVERELLTIAGVEGVHDMHVWSVSSTDTVLSAHVQVADTQVSRATALVDEVKAALRERFGIRHATLELECAGRVCADGCCVFATPAS